MKIVIADDHQLILEGFSQVLKNNIADADVFMAKDLTALNEILSAGDADILFQDIRFGKDDAREFLAGIMESYPTLKIIILTSIMETGLVESLFKMGVTGYLLKSDESDEICRAIHSVRVGEKFISTELKEIISGNRVDFYKNIIITPREKEILDLILQEKTTREIAREVFLSEKTIENYRASLFLKFDVKNMAGLVRKAVLEGYI